MMKTAVQRTLLSALSPAGRRARLMIFTFHRTPEVPDALLPGEPDAQRLRKVLGWIADLCRVLPLDEAVRALKAGTLPERAAAITFDDGYRNNLTVAKPALVQAGLPATVFVAADPVRRGFMWNDLIIEAARRAPSAVDLGDLGLGSLDPEGGRRPALERLIGLLKYRDPVERLELATEIHQRAAGAPPERLMLTEDEVRKLQGDGISLGSHTINHPILTALDDASARWEIAASRDWIEEVAGVRPALFAYPNGRPGDDYDHRHVAMVKEAGFAAAMSTSWSAAYHGSPTFELPRFTPWEQDAAGFGARLLKTCLGSYRTGKGAVTSCQ